MHIRRLVALLAGIALVLSGCATVTVSVPSPGTNAFSARIVAYYVSWGIYARHYTVADIPADKVTHLNYAFANISPEGTIVPGDAWADVQKQFPGDLPELHFHGNFNQLVKLKREHPRLRTLISVGGWTWSKRFSDVAATVESRSRFAESAVSFLRTYHFDGVDLDWEYPVAGGSPANAIRAEDRANFTSLLATMRSALDVAGSTDDKHYLLTIAAPAGASTMAHFDLPGIAAVVDWINVMTYDYHVSSEPTTGYDAPLYGSAGGAPSVDTTIHAYLAAGVPASKLVMGVPLYGRSWKGVAAVNNGVGQRVHGFPPGTWDKPSAPTGVMDYTDIMNRFGSWIRWDPRADASFAYDPSAGIFITFDSPQAARAKAAYIRREGLGGVMIWQITSDYRGSLLDIYDKALDPLLAGR
ncbi:MAG TPA: glycoside hydrolase family 18 protein [Spirochaetia bacterium]|nr:glycoside hydrolase family 18 protein [Spirochaetia bacterium]